MEVRIKLLGTFYTNLSHQTANKLCIFIMILRKFCNPCKYQPSSHYWCNKAKN